MKQRAYLQRILVFFIALSFLPLLISGSSTKGSTNDRSNVHSTNRLISGSTYRFAEIICAEELLSPGNTKITRYDTSRKLTHPRFFEHYFNSSSFLLFASCILCLKLLLVHGSIRASRKFIIKYIHDQDGHKILPSYYWHSFTS